MPHEWQPIETGPKDYSNVLLCDERGKVRIGHYRPWWPDGEDPCWLYVGKVSDWSRKYQPTHWMPLPQPPK